jgi:hypothetical protein
MPNDRVRLSECQNAREELRAVEDRAVAIRRLLKQFEQRVLDRGVMGDALQLADVIECLARFGQRSSAADAVESISQIAILESLLHAEIDGFLAS